ncbi:HNH endonuclease signature motif containing protein [Bdellovibrionota bacterium FG-2]
MLNLRRVQDLLSQARGKPVTLEEVISTLAQEHINRHDPVQRAKRQIIRKGKQVQPPTPVALQEPPEKGPKTESAPAHQRTPIPANLLHQVRLRDQGRCTHTSSKGQRCRQSRWVDIHHKIPVAEGGQNTLENLTTVCSTHHAWIHASRSKKKHH